MLSKEQKKEASNQFRERKSPLGVYAVRCTVNASVWVGSSRNLNAARNSIWFSLRMGNHRDQPLQQEWNTHGEGSFEYVVLELLDDDVPALLIPELLKAAKQRWINQLEARALL